MSATEACDLCGLPVLKDGLHLKTVEKEMAFCCEGCRGIWVMLNPDTVKNKGTGNDE
jgi:hypothetical protein